jgi:glycosyltransferase involved in cell wall biosynthesis
LTLHGLDVPVKYIGRYKKLFAISNSVKDDIISRANINSIVVYNGISTSLIDIKQKYIFKSKFKIVCVGRLDHKIKGQHLAIQAIYFLSKKGVNNIQLDLIGTGCSEEYLKKLTAEYGLSEKVTFLGLKDRDYIYGQLKVYDLLIQPSLFEGFGLTLAESMAAKIPFLVSNIQGPMEVIDNGKNGYCFEVGNVKSLVEKIELIIANYYSEDMYQMIESAHIRVKTCFDIKETAKKYIDEYLLN